jgi:hypothetical protein
MTSKVFALDTKPGIQRDGTLFDKDFYTDGRWVRFQRGRPRKMAGFRVISDQMKGPSRGMWVYPQDAFNGIFSGYSDGLQELFIDDNGIGSGITDFTLSDFTANPNNLGSSMAFITSQAAFKTYWRTLDKTLPPLTVR